MGTSSDSGYDGSELSSDGLHLFGESLLNGSQGARPCGRIACEEMSSCRSAANPGREVHCLNLARAQPAYVQPRRPSRRSLAARVILAEPASARSACPTAGTSGASSTAAVAVFPCAWWERGSRELMMWIEDTPLLRPSAGRHVPHHEIPDELIKLTEAPPPRGPSPDAGSPS